LHAFDAQEGGKKLKGAAWNWGAEGVGGHRKNVRKEYPEGNQSIRHSGLGKIKGGEDWSREQKTDLTGKLTYGGDCLVNGSPGYGGGNLRLHRDKRV